MRFLAPIGVLVIGAAIIGGYFAFGQESNEKGSKDPFFVEEVHDTAYGSQYATCSDRDVWVAQFDPKRSATMKLEGLKVLQVFGCLEPGDKLAWVNSLQSLERIAHQVLDGTETIWYGFEIQIVILGVTNGVQESSVFDDGGAVAYWAAGFN